MLAGCNRDSKPAQDGSVELISTANAAPPPSVELDPSVGGEPGPVYEAYLNPMQEPAEESDAPKAAPAMFRSSTPSKTRAQRVADGHRGHGKVRFSKDLSRAWVDVKIEGVAVDTINMFHIHCGKPGVLGPILVDFSLLSESIQANFVDDGVFSVEVTNEVITATAEHGHGALAAFTAGCLVGSASLEVDKPTKVSTVAGMAAIAAEGELYFNLHTTGQTFYGDLRGQILPPD
ncbi:hypothetical protein DB30_07321 [Enhygromyxa salina]|uniref:CHRD domain-containing protein n=2 Tax=Enhygromyxa salina TaxID=215803 RepID=A0A0C1Z8V7_9BACT|nr:hypothetical protein DB30_07321 [Enhygromyxa salina]